jgi:hypothetical protein
LFTLRCFEKLRSQVARVTKLSLQDAKKEAPKTEATINYTRDHTLASW